MNVINAHKCSRNISCVGVIRETFNMKNELCLSSSFSTEWIKIFES